MREIKSGSHLESVRNWIQNHYCFGNGETVSWGSSEVLKGKDVRVNELERLAQDIRDSVLSEYKVKPFEHQYKFVMIADKPFSQFVDTSTEAWAKLFKIGGLVCIYRLTEGRLGCLVTKGNAEEVGKWLHTHELAEWEEIND